jgi:membrane protein DedA with SNARE-associated domain/rhodanese-related sulfurtransferase
VTEHLQFLLHYGYALLFAWVFVEQIGVPLPSIPILLAAGALIGTHQFNAPITLIVPVIASLIADFFWYELGRRKGIRVLRLLCKISIEPDSCVRRTENTFAKQGSRSLLISKFIPGLGIMTPPLAGIFHMKLRKFLAMDGLGALIWAGAYVGVGYAFSNQIEVIARHAAHLGIGLVILVVAAFGGWIGWKFIRRRRFIRQLRVDRITARELKDKMDSGEEVVIVDLRGPLDFEEDPDMIPGAVHLEIHDIEHVTEQLAQAPEVVLYCTCPNEATSAQVARQLKTKGVRKIRPLAGGLDGWRELGFPVSIFDPDAE